MHAFLWNGGDGKGRRERTSGAPRLPRVFSGVRWCAGVSYVNVTVETLKRIAGLVNEIVCVGMFASQSNYTFVS